MFSYLSVRHVGKGSMNMVTADGPVSSFSLEISEGQASLCSGWGTVSLLV